MLKLKMFRKFIHTKVHWHLNLERAKLYFAKWKESVKCKLRKEKKWREDRVFVCWKAGSRLIIGDFLQCLIAVAERKCVRSKWRKVRQNIFAYCCVYSARKKSIVSIINETKSTGKFMIYGRAGLDDSEGNQKP